MKFKNQLILKEGTWNDVFYSKEEIKKGFEKIKKILPIYVNFEENTYNLIGFADNFRLNQKEIIADITIKDKRILDIMKDFKISAAPQLCGFEKMNRSSLLKKWGWLKTKPVMINFEIISLGLVTNPSDRDTLFKIEKKIKRRQK